MLNLLKDTKPKWDFDFTSKAEINIYPSIWRNIGCKSHFFIKNVKEYVYYKNYYYYAHYNKIFVFHILAPNQINF